MNNEEIQNLKKQIHNYFMAKKQGASNKTLIKKAEHIKYDAQNYEGNDEWINAFKYGETIINIKTKAKLYFKMGF